MNEKKIDSDRPSRASRWKKIGAGVVSALFIGAAIAQVTGLNILGIFTDSSLTATAAPDASPDQQAVGNVITSPTDGSAVPHDAVIEGTAILADGVVETWLFVEVPGVGYYPGPSPLGLGADGQWLQVVHFGSPSDASQTPYRIHLVGVDEQGAATVAEYREQEVASGDVVGFQQSDMNEPSFIFLDTKSVERR